jgi:hypothetical protein
VSLQPLRYMKLQQLLLFCSDRACWQVSAVSGPTEIMQVRLIDKLAGWCAALLQGNT